MTENIHHDPHRVVCVGDVLASRRTGATETLERLCRIHAPRQPWKFWHLGDATTTARILLQEAIWRALGFDAGRLLLSLGSAEAASPTFSPSDTLDEIRQCLELLADKGPKEIWVLLPVPSLWPLDLRGDVESVRSGIAALRGRWRVVDAEPAATAFLHAQATHPDTAAALVEDSPSGPVPTGTGALLLADQIRRAWEA
jgi:hypothetical protein